VSRPSNFLNKVDLQLTFSSISTLHSQPILAWRLGTRSAVIPSITLMNFGINFKRFTDAWRMHHAEVCLQIKQKLYKFLILLCETCKRGARSLWCQCLLLDHLWWLQMLLHMCVESSVNKYDKILGSQHTLCCTLHISYRSGWHVDIRFGRGCQLVRLVAQRLKARVSRSCLWKIFRHLAVLIHELRFPV